MQIWKKYNKQKKRDIWHARFRCNKKPFSPTAETKSELEDLIAEIRRQEKVERDNKKYNLGKTIPLYVPTVEKIFAEELPLIEKPHQRKIAERVFRNFQALLPALIKVSELKTFHFQQYLNFRKNQLGKQTGKPVKPTTIIKELYAITSALKESRGKYEGLENWQIPPLPELPKGTKKKARRERLVADNELQSIISELLKEPKGKQRQTGFHRVRLAHQIEFQHETGFRRKEIAALKFAQMDRAQHALLNVKRWKTGTITKFFPLSKRAFEIIEARKELQTDCDYIFTPDGKPIESNYRTLKEICETLDIPYGRFTEGGFVAHDFRHNFATEISQVTDIETAKSLTGHTGTEIFTYLHTNRDRQREAVRKREKFDFDGELEEIFDQIKGGKLRKKEFVEKVKKLFGF